MFMLNQTLPFVTLGMHLAILGSVNWQKLGLNLRSHASNLLFFVLCLGAHFKAILVWKHTGKFCGH